VAEENVEGEQEERKEEETINHLIQPRHVALHVCNLVQEARKERRPGRGVAAAAIVVVVVVVGGGGVGVGGGGDVVVVGGVVVVGSVGGAAAEDGWESDSMCLQIKATLF